MSGGPKQTSTTTSEIKLPEWLNQGAQKTFTDAQAAAAANPIKAYTQPMVAGSNAQLDAAGQMALGGMGVGAGDLDRARALTDQAAGATTGRVNIDSWDNSQASKYMNPYQQAVQSRTLDMMTKQNERQLNDLGDKAQMQKAYGGTRHAVAEGVTRGEQNDNMLDYLARSNAAAYDDAYGKFSGDRSASMGAQSTNASLDAADAARIMGGGAQFGQIGGQASAMNQQDVDTLLRSGLITQETANQMLGADYNEFLRMQDAPMMRYQQLMSLLSGAPTDRSETGTGTQKSKTSTFDKIAGAGLMGLSFFSDRRLKRDIERIFSGLYRFKYLWSDDSHVGVMADEVPAHAKTRIFGFDAVDYGQLGAA